MNDMKRSVLVLNSGSSSIKFALFRFSGGGGPDTLYRGEVEDIGTAPKFTLRDGKGIAVEDKELDPGKVSDHEDSFRWLEAWIDSNLADVKLSAVGHRVVHGGAVFTSPVVIDKDVMAKLTDLEKLAPLHQPYNIAGIRAVIGAHPGLPQVACFDTSFHRTQPKVAEMFGLPLDYFDSGVLRYGFHGLSYEYIAGKIWEVASEHAGGRLIVAHLGSGASMCAIKEGKSVATTMGFTAVDGLPMGTRSGSIDPGVIIHLMREEGLTPGEVEELIYKKSGLLGISGMTNDMEILQSSPDPRARLAVDYFVYRAVREACSLAGALGGVDALVFTAGIGENSAPVRERICGGLGLLGVEIDTGSNERNETRISTPESITAVYVIPTNEELMIARHTAQVLGLSAD